jgi:2,3-bisphosphoglycerate-independent phosphoglycerate mutase
LPDPALLAPTRNLAIEEAPSDEVVVPMTQEQAESPMRPIISSRPMDNMIQSSNYNGPHPVVLLILDGWGLGPANAGNAIQAANTPNIDKYWLSYPHTQIEASGQAVGLPQGEDGNTETGHLNIGAGHIVYQDLPRINMAIADGSFYVNEAFLNSVKHVKQYNSTLHLMGLIGAGGVHSNIEHLYALLNFCKQQGLTKVYIHGFTDGRDSPPTSGINYVQQIMEHCASTGVGQLASLMGRYFAMDRDKRWERIEKAYNALTLGDGSQCILDPIASMRAQYDKGITDEFIEPISICNEDGSHRVIDDNDAVIFFNYRIDRPRELTRALVMPDFEQGIHSVAFDPYTEKYEKTNIQEQKMITTFQRQRVINNLYFVTMTRYEDNIPVDVGFPPQFIKQPLGKVLSDNGLRQLRITETEKERFVTYYMNGQKDDMFPGEQRVIVPSKGVKSYDEAPEMSSREVASEMITRLMKNTVDVVICNICNGDMVGHTGNLQAAIKACEIVDEVVGKIVNTVLLLDGIVLITADHGNVEEMINNKTGQMDTEHSKYPVPLLIISKQFANKPTMLPSGILADIAPTMLHLMGIEKPASMTGRALI